VIQLSLRASLVGYVLLLTFLLLAVAGATYRLAEDLESDIQLRLRLDEEQHDVRRIVWLSMQEADLSDDLLIQQDPIDSARYSMLRRELQRRISDLQSLPPLGVTSRPLALWIRQHALYQQQLLASVAAAPALSFPQLKACLSALRVRCDEQMRTLASLEHSLRQLTDASDLAIRTRVAGHWPLIVGLCLIPILLGQALVISFARKLGRHVHDLRTGLERLASGDFEARLASAVPATGPRNELQQLMQDFDRTAARLKEISGSRSQLYSMAAHDLRSPLSTIILSARMLSEKPELDDHTKKILAAINRKAAWLHGLVDALLETFFIDSSQLQLNFQPADVNVILADCVDGLEAQAADRQQHLVLQPLAGDSTIDCDPTKLFQVIENLISNAIKYSRAGDAILVSAEPAGDDRVLFIVEDHGPGIPSEERERIFQPFHRVSATSGATQGHGLGLTICQGFVKAHGGTIRVESSPGGGSRFLVEIPRKPAPPTSKR
jgi:signal transduction histidine kinase